MSSIFTKIIKGEIPSYKVAESEDYFAFLDINPVERGHTLVIPKQETDYLFDLDDELYLGLQAFAKRVAAAMEKVVDCKRIGVAVLGLEVPHAHIHLIPIHNMQSLSFEKERVEMSKDAMAELSQQIAAAF